MRFINILIIVLLFSFNLQAYEPDNYNWENLNKTDYKKHFDLGFSVGIRTDERNSSFTKTPTFSGRLLYKLNWVTALKVGLGITPQAKNSYSDSRVISYYYELGVRFRRPEKIISPFVEFGLNRAIHNDKKNLISYSDWRTGYSLGTGFEINISKGICLDVFIQQILNNAYDGAVHYSELPNETNVTPPDNTFYFGDITPRFGDQFFNPTTIEFQIRYSL